MAEETKKEKEKEGGEKVVIIPLRRKTRKSPRNYRMKHSVREIRTFLAKHMKSSPSNVSISQQLNESLWKGGIHRPPAKLKLKVNTGDEGKIFARLLEEKERPKKEKKKAGLRERLARRKEAAKSEEKPSAEKREERPLPKEQAKSEPAKEKPKPPERKEEEARKEIEQEILLEQ